MNVWKTDSPVVTFSSLNKGTWPLHEGGKGMEPGWVSQWKDKKAQKQPDGSWTHVPQDTPLGMQPFYKSAGPPESFKPTPDEEMMAYLKSIHFDEPETQAVLTKNPKFTADMLKKFGAGFYDKFKKLSAQANTPASAPTTPSPPPAETGTPAEQAMKKLNLDPDSPSAFGVSAFHKHGSLESAVEVYSQKFGVKYAVAYEELENLMKKGASKGVWNVTGDFDDGYKIAFNVGTGPVISAPAIAATTSVPALGPVQTQPQPKAVKAKKPTPSDATPVPVAVPEPELKAEVTPTEPKVIAIAQKLGQAPDSNTAKIINVWRKFLQKGGPDSISQTIGVVTAQSGWAKPKVSKFVTDLISKVWDLPGIDLSDFAVDSGGSGPEKKKAEPVSTPIPSTQLPPTPPTTPAVQPPPGLPAVPEVPSLAVDKAISDMVAKLGFKMGTAGAVAVAALTMFDGDLNQAAKAVKAGMGLSSDNAAFKVAKFVQAKMNAFKAGTEVPQATGLLAKMLGVPPSVPEPKKKPRAGPDVQYVVPNVATLSYVGDAKTKLGGNKPKKFVKDEQGNIYLHKYGAEQIRAAGGEVASNIAALVVGAGNYVPVKAVEYEGDWGTIQPMVKNLDPDGLPADPTSLSKEDLKQLQRERVLDWVTSSHDTKVGNFIRTKKGQIFGIDKEQAFKFLGTDQLSLDYSPNPSEPYYNSIYKAYADKKLSIDPNDMLPYIQNIESVSDEDWLAAAKPYLDVFPPSEAALKKKAILDRKHNVRKDFEAFFTTLKKKRGEDGAFTFAVSGPVATQTVEPAKAPEPEAELKPIAGLGVLAKPKVPSLASLTYFKAATGIGGAGEKHFFKDPTDGKLWLLKVAANKGNKKPEPWKQAAQTLTSMVGKAIKPHTLEVGAVEYGGKPATLQPWLGDNLTTLSGESPSDLTPVQKKDVADEHVLDWLMSQHDTHGANLVVVPATGAIVGVDKEQGYKYLLPPYGDKLATDYHPNAQHGEQEPYYNKFWKAFASGEMSFDPMVMKGAIEAAEKIPDDQFSAALAAYGQVRFPTDAAMASQFYEKAFARKKNLRKEFEAFITEQYWKRTKKLGLFTFATGWVPEGATAPLTPVATPAPSPVQKPPVAKTTPIDAPVEKPAGFVPVAMPVFNAAASKLGFSTGSVYRHALQQLRLYNNDVKSAANQLSFLKSIAPDIALKRVKYAAKKLKDAGGWAAFDTSNTPTAAPAAFTPVSPANPPSSLGGGTPTTTFIPGNNGELGNSGVKMVTPTDAYKPPPPPPLPPVPAGYSNPPEGKMWELKKANAFFGAGTGGYLYKTKPPKKPDGEPDTESPNLVAKFHNTSLSAVKEAFEQVGVQPVVPPKEKGAKVVALVEKSAWAKAQASDKTLGVLVDLPPPPPPPSGKFMPVPQAGELNNAPATAGMAELNNVENAQLGYGGSYRLGGSGVEHHSMSVQRRTNKEGKQFYRFMFKLREPVWSKLKGFDSVQGEFYRASYNSKTDSFKETDTSDCDYSGRRWTAGAGSRATLCADDNKYALKGMVTAEIFPEPGQTPVDALRKLLKSMGPGLEDEVLKDPTPEDEKLLKLSALYWSASPAKADALTESQRDIEYLTAELKKLGYTDEKLDSIRFERVGVDQIVPVLPGRSKEIQAKHGISHISVAISSPDKVMQQIRGGTVGVVQRLKHGFTLSGTSTTSDLESGGADYVFTMPGKKSATAWGNQWGDIEMVYDPSEYDRLDSFMYTFDGYGRTKGPKFHTRQTLESSAGSAAEIVFRQGLSVNKLLKIRCQSSANAQDIIQRMKDAGITQINGMKPEELVVVGDSFYSTFLKPGGY